ncbi:MAG: RnfABCDGE type electron transport complex subunit D [Candidatus Kaelpia aquatica]|nr:RnfABCDGE type electron transport complex subunit D [Candidatus Kaelpia aquatica]
MEDNRLIISGSPHIKGALGLRFMMWNVVIALIPVIAVSIYFFRFNALRIMAVSLVASLIAEALFLKLRRKEIDFLDGSTVITALLFALILPPSLPSWMVALGAIFAIIFGKGVFGGLGYNVFNPALIGRAFLQASYPIAMTSYSYPFGYKGSLDAVTAATPLGLAKFNEVYLSLRSLFWGNIPGSLGETCAFAIILGGIYLLSMRVIDYRIPLSGLLSFSFISGVFYLINPAKFSSPLFGILGGGFLIGLFFMATDPVTTPLTKRGKCIFGLGVGSLVFLIRSFSGLPEGVMYSILIMNAVTPLINRTTLSRRFGL